ncbi:uncharacterized protein TNCV_610901 [Trichonephila clavipes]|nr:uncharacterized protein TNCV_610901 [Trichonephila clavipes]
MAPRREASIDFDIRSQNYVAAGIGLALQWILINGSERYLFSPFTGPRVNPISLHFKDSVTIDTATRGLLATDHVIWNHGQVTWTTPELAPPLLTTTPPQRKDVSALDRFNVHRYPTRRVFSGTGLEPVTRQATVRYLYQSATTATFHF